MNEEPTPDRYPIKIYFRGMAPEDCPSYLVTADTLAAISADWQRSRPVTPLATAIQRDTSPQVYEVYPWGMRDQRPRPLMFRLEDVLFIG